MSEEPKAPKPITSEERQLIQQVSSLLRSSPLAPGYMAAKTGLSYSTLRRLRTYGGESYRPQMRTLEFALRPLGLRLTITEGPAK